MANPKGRNDNELHIKNPQRTVLRIWLFILVLFTLLLVKSFVSFDINSLDGMIIVTSLMIIPTSLFFVWTTSKNIKNLDEAIDRGKMIAHWRYSEKEWVAYLDFERSYRKNLGTMIAALLTVFTVVIFVPFAIVVQEFFMIIVMLGLVGMYWFMGLILPRIMFQIRKRGVREVLLLEKGVMVGKQFHTWDFPLSKFKKATHVKEDYEYLEVVYDFVDRTGPRTYAVNVPIPQDNMNEIGEIIGKFK
jgi:hypothetical protein